MQRLSAEVLPKAATKYRLSILATPLDKGLTLIITLRTAILSHVEWSQVRALEFT